MFADWPYPKANYTFLYSGQEVFLTWREVPTKIRLLLSHRDRRTGALSPLMIIFQRDVSQVLEKDISWVLNCQETFKRIYVHFKRGREFSLQL